MEKRDEELIASLLDEEPELKELMAQHRALGERVDELSKRPYLTTEETMEKKRLQKLKLSGRDRIESILARYRKS
ncbi:MAG: DUF465 domain-containing protein [Deltaproteobacteria bacterium]|nr:DUF465 domain-containing protein [Deltaproteobacteria bacterium]MBW2051779.1 DUF465 domain-containing protein [Deltaproteobacteria bacterium]MBW2140625.1 DUF465 domain-containing protein [Deltaproteobacteria bacterium]MBW2323312.1 DUF465 domain-containing protein [Deltaproteobacteria bacterium]